MKLQLPSGSFSLQDIERVGEEALAGATPAEQERIMRDGLDRANRRIDEVSAANALPDHVVEPRNRVVAEGDESGNGRAVVQEQIQIYKPPEASGEESVAGEPAAQAPAAESSDPSAAGAGEQGE